MAGALKYPCSRSGKDIFAMGLSLFFSDPLLWRAWWDCTVFCIHAEHPSSAPVMALEICSVAPELDYWQRY